MRTIGVVTGARSDFGIYLPMLKAIQAEKQLQLQLYVTGMHLSAQHGMTVRNIKAAGFPVTARIPCLGKDDSPQAMGKAMAKTTAGFVDALTKYKPDILVVLGDRFEMHAAAVAAVPLRIPLAHLHGGELTYGALDEQFRHSLTKLSHLHFVSTPEYGSRVQQMGEAAWRVHVCGALSLDTLGDVKLLTTEELQKKFSLKLDKPPLLITYHPATQEPDQAGRQMKSFLQALSAFKEPMVFTMPNADPGGLTIRAAIQTFIKKRKNTFAVETFGQQGYFSMMSHARAMVGNSSSGILEAASFRLPVVNIGSRQEGRVRARNVIDCGCTASQIREALNLALSDQFLNSLCRLKNPYFRGGAAGMILGVLKNVRLDNMLLMKRFGN